MEPIQDLYATEPTNQSVKMFTFAPPEPNSQVGETESIEVAYCLQSGHGARPIPAGTILAAHFIETPSYIQISGTGDFTKINIQAGDQGGELDPHGATGSGNPIGGVVFSNPLSGVSVLEWNSFISATEFCIKVAKPASDDYKWAQHVYDVMGCGFNMPGNYGSGFDSCKADNADGYPGIYGTSTFSQGDGRTPLPHNAGATSQCNVVQTIGGGVAAAPAPMTSASSTSTASSVVPTSTSSLVSSSSVSSSSSLFVPLSSSVSSTFESLATLPTPLPSSATLSSLNSSTSISSTASTSLASSAASTASVPVVTRSSIVTVSASSPTSLARPTSTSSTAVNSSGKVTASLALGGLTLVCVMMSFA